MPIHALNLCGCVCVCVCVLYMYWICCVAVRKDKPSNTRTAHIHLFSFSPSAVSQVCLLCAACRREFWETSVLQLCIYWSCGNVACTLLTDCHTAAFSQCAMLHTVWPAGSFHCCKNQSMKVRFTLISLCTKNSSSVLHLVVSVCVFKRARSLFFCFFWQKEDNVWAEQPRSYRSWEMQLDVVLLLFVVCIQ